MILSLKGQNIESRNRKGKWTDRNSWTQGFSFHHFIQRHMSDEIGFIWKAMSIFAKHEISIEHIPSGIDNIGVIVSAEAIADKLFHHERIKRNTWRGRNRRD